MNGNMSNVYKIHVMLKILIWRNTDHLKKRGFTFDSSGLSTDRSENDVSTSWRC